MSEYNLMKILILLSIFISSSIVSADIDFDQKLDFIVAKQFSEDTKEEIVEITFIALKDMDIDISSVDNFEEAVTYLKGRGSGIFPPQQS